MLFLNKMFYRISFIILFLFLGIMVFAQNPLEKRATVAVQKECLESVLATITKQTGVRFSYNSQLIDPKTKITVNAQNKTVKEILAVILPPSVSYKNVGEYIVFAENKVETDNYLPLQKKNEKNIISNNGMFPDSCLNSKDTIILNSQEIDMNIKELMLATTIAAAAATTPVLAQDTLNDNFQQQQFEQPQIEQQEIEQPQTVQLQEKTTPKCKPAQVTFFYPLGSSWVKSAENCYHFSLNILGGVTGQIKGVEIGSLFNINKYGVKGVQFAGIFNATGSKENHNAQFAGIFNLTKGKSAQFAGIFNVGDTAYIQVGGIFNVGKTAYVQAAGIGNYGNTAYIQAAGIFNYGNIAYLQAAGIGNAAKHAKFQAAGIFNQAQKSSCQIAGIFNSANESKVQMAGIVNVTKAGRFQMGLINVRDTADGVSFGLINVVKRGGVMEVGVEAGEFIHTALTFRSGVQRLYTIISAGGNYTEKFLTVGTGLGTSVKLIGNLSMNFELTHSALYDFDNLDSWHNLTRFSPQLNYRFAKHFKIFVGPTVNLSIQNVPYISDLIKVPYSFYNRINKNYNYLIYDKELGKYTTEYTYTVYDMWVGIVGGIKF